MMSKQFGEELKRQKTLSRKRKESLRHLLRLNAEALKALSSNKEIALKALFSSNAQRRSA